MVCVWVGGIQKSLQQCYIPLEVLPAVQLKYFLLQPWLLSSHSSLWWGWGPRSSLLGFHFCLL